jgi:tetratricopeptide (TPR) repeat protein
MKKSNLAHSARQLPTTTASRLIAHVASWVILLALNLSGSSAVFAQSGMTLFGDVKVDESKAGDSRIGSLTVVLYTLGGTNIVGRVTVPVNGRYRFNNVRAAEYELAIEAQSNEIARIHISVSGRAGSDFQQDLEFEWKPPANSSKPKTGTISAADLYKRNAANETIFKRAQLAIDKKNYDQAVALFRQIVDNDSHDYQAWTELGTAYLLLDKKGDAEKAYERAVDARPTFTLALLNLGRVRLGQKKYDEAITTLTRLLELEPASPDGNYLLGEAYLQIRKGSKAVPYLNEAAHLGRPEAHLRLATLYDAAGSKDRAASEYEEYLKKKPDDPLRQKLEKYISEHKKK